VLPFYADPHGGVCFFASAMLSSPPPCAPRLHQHKNRRENYRLTERFSILLQLHGITSPVRNTGLDIDQSTFEILAGFNWTLPGLPVVWQAGFMEDSNDTNRTADFALFMSWSLFFGHRAATPR
jgi:hypothetical protein